MQNSNMTVGIAGAGSVAFATAALLMENGHQVRIWSPSGRQTALSEGVGLVSTGMVQGKFKPEIADSAEELSDGVDVLFLALPGNGHKAVMDDLAPHVRNDQTIIISSHASFGALYFNRLIEARGVLAPIVAWGTTVVTGAAQDDSSVVVSTVRSKVDMCTIPAGQTSQGLKVCQALFGDRFVQRDGLMAITLSNLNPQNHLGIALGNITRMELGEEWDQCKHVTPKVGRLLEELDKERLAIAEKLGLSVRTIFEHFHLSFHVPVASISEMNRQLYEEGNGGNGPTTEDSRYVTEDVPYGLVPIAWIGDLVGCPTPLHKAGIQILSAMYARNFEAENDLLVAGDFKSLSLEQLERACIHGMSSPRMNQEADESV